MRGRELVRLLLQRHLDLLAAAEERRDDMAGEDGVVRTRAERGRVRPLVTKFGQFSVSLIAYRSPGLPSVHPLDAVLNLPEEKHSHGLRGLAAVEAARGSMEAAGGCGKENPRGHDGPDNTPLQSLVPVDPQGQIIAGGAGQAGHLEARQATPAPYPGAGRVVQARCPEPRSP